jgi:putative hydrolase of the HAD superfamily
MRIEQKMVESAVGEISEVLLDSRRSGKDKATLVSFERGDIAMYQAILFDLDDTLFSLRRCEAHALRRTLESAGLLARLPADFTERYAAISAKHWAAPSAAGYTEARREAVTGRSWRDFLSQHGLDAQLAKGLAAQFWLEFCHSSALNPGAAEVLRGLSDSFRLGMITNGYSDSQRGRLRAAGLYDAFDPLLISDEVGVQKPDKQIFEMALAHLGLGPESVLYVGDSISHDHEGCLRAGLDFCHYCPAWRATDGLPPVKFRIERLPELIAILQPDQTP